MLQKAYGESTKSKTRACVVSGKKRLEAVEMW
jgi:hypothetical protein